MAGNGTRKKQENLSPGEKRRLRQYKQICKKRGVNENPVPALSEPTPNDVPPWM